MYALVVWILEGLYSVISLGAIVSPRKEFNEYKPGDDVEAKFQGKPYPAKLIDVGDNKKVLEKELDILSSQPYRKCTKSSPIESGESGSTRKEQQCDLSRPKTSKGHAASGSRPKTSKGHTAKESGTTRTKPQGDLPIPFPKTSQGTAAKSVQLGKRKNELVSVNEETNAADINASIQEFFNNVPPTTSTPAKTPVPAMIPTPAKTPVPAMIPVPATVERHKRYQTPKFIESESSSDLSEDDTTDDVHLATLANVPIKVPRLHREPSPCRRDECVRTKRELGQLREKVGSMEAMNKKLQRINKELEAKSKRTDSGVSLHEQSSSDIIIDKLKPGIVSDRSAAREHKMVELVRGSYVFLYENQLKLATESSKSMTALARHLVDVFFSLDVQKISNLSGSNGLNALDKTIINAIIAYSVSCEQFKRQSPAEIRQSLRNKLGCLRAPSRTKKDNL